MGLVLPFGSLTELYLDQVVMTSPLQISMLCKSRACAVCRLGLGPSLSTIDAGRLAIPVRLYIYTNQTTTETIMSSSSSSDPSVVVPKKQLSFREIVEKSAASAARGGIAGACAMGANVAALMWIRTTVRACV